VTTPRTPFLRSPEFRRIQGHCIALLFAFGAMMLAALELRSRPTTASAEDAAAPPAPRGTVDFTAAFQDDAFGELVKRAAKGGGAFEPVPAADLQAHPGDRRGAGVRFTGVFLADPVRQEIEPVALAAGEAPPDVSQAMEATLLDPVTGHVLRATFLEPGPRAGAHRRVVVEGFFWKIESYRNRRGETVSAPYLVAKSWTLEPRPPETSVLPLLMSLTGGIAVASIVLGAQASRRRVA
jgi:hypothetical protein